MDLIALDVTDVDRPRGEAVAADWAALLGVAAPLDAADDCDGVVSYALLSRLAVQAAPARAGAAG